MLDLIGSGSRTCDGVSRRDFIRVGGLAAGGLTSEHAPSGIEFQIEADTTQSGHPDLASRRA